MASWTVGSGPSIVDPELQKQLMPAKMHARQKTDGRGKTNVSNTDPRHKHQCSGCVKKSYDCMGVCVRLVARLLCRSIRPHVAIHSFAAKIRQVNIHCVHPSIHTNIHTDIRTDIHTHIHMCVCLIYLRRHLSIYVSMNLSIYTFVYIHL